MADHIPQGYGYTVVGFTLFILIGSAAIVVTDATSPGNGEVPYNPSAVWLFVEAIKLLVAGILWQCGACTNAKEGDGKKELNEGSISWLTWFRFGIPSALYAAGNNVTILAVIYLGAPYFALGTVRIHRSVSHQSLRRRKHFFMNGSSSFSSGKSKDL